MGIKAYFTGKVDHRYAWIGNDANGSVDILSELKNLVASATTSIAVSTMTFNYSTDATATAADQAVLALAGQLAAQAHAGKLVRIVGNGGHRYQSGYFRSLRGPVQLADNNLPALVARISFQTAASPAPAGFLIDSGAVFGPRPSGLSYGWDMDVTSKIAAHSDSSHPIDAGFTSPLLRECYASSNASAPRTWKIALPAGHYYVHVATGEAAYNSKTFVLAQQQTIFLTKSAGVYLYNDHTDSAAGNFDGSTVDGGTDPDTGLPMARRLDVSSGMLEVTIGKMGQGSYSSLDYIEIYRASDTYPNGDMATDKTRVQDRSLHHTKFVLIDAETANPRLWTGSHNLTPVDPTAADARSEDALLIDDPAICSAFKDEFNQWWGAASGVPVPAASRLGLFKAPINASGTVTSTLPGVTAAWRVCFSPSINTAPGLNLYQKVADFLSSGTEDALFLLEQVTEGGNFTSPFGTFPGSAGLITLLRNKALSGQLVQGLCGNTDLTDGIFTQLSGIANAKVGPSTGIHDKCVCQDTLRDNPTRLRGKLLCGSMNWSQDALCSNDEQTLIIEDPALANEYLQRAAAAFTVDGIALAREADCVLVIDRSYSMNQPAAAGSTKIAAARVAAKLFVEMLDHQGKHRLALVRFGTVVEPFVPPSTLASLTAATTTQCETEVDNIVADLPIGNSTCYGLALQEALSLVTSSAQPTARRLIVFLSDGLENTAPWSGPSVTAIADQGIELHTTAFGAVGLTADATLENMAKQTGGTFAHVDDDTLQLQKRFADVARDAMNMTTILDPSWTLGPGEAFEQQFPVDMHTGLLQIVLLWGDQGAGPESVQVRTPPGVLLSASGRGVERRRTSGCEVWRIDLAQFGARYRREPRGRWTLSAKAPERGTSGYRVSMCVFASDHGVARIPASIGQLGKNSLPLRFRVWAGDRLLNEPHATITHVTHGETRRTMPVPFALMPQKELRWQGVHEALLKIESPGVHEVHLVVEGEIEAMRLYHQPREGELLTVPFRREKTISWVHK